MLAPMRPFLHPASETLELPRVLHALADPARLDIVRRIARGGELTCGALTDERPKSSMSHHFRVLREAGLISTRIVGSEHLNALRREDIEARFPGLLGAVLGAAEAA